MARLRWNYNFYKALNKYAYYTVEFLNFRYKIWNLKLFRFKMKNHFWISFSFEKKI